MDVHGIRAPLARAFAVGACAAITFAAAGCGGGDDTASTASTAAAAAAATAPTTTASGALAGVKAYLAQQTAALVAFTSQFKADAEQYDALATASGGNPKR